MLRYAIPVVVGLCGFGAERFHNARQDHDRREPAVEQHRDRDCDAPRPRFDDDRREERCEPRHGRSWHVDIDVRRDDRSDRDGRFGGHRR